MMNDGESLPLLTDDSLSDRSRVMEAAENLGVMGETIKVEAIGLFEGLRRFIERGPVLELAVGGIAGVLFNQVVKSLSDDILLPPLGLLSGFTLRNFFFVIRHGATASTYVTLQDAMRDGAVTINLGLFLQNVIDFLISTTCLYTIMTLGNRFLFPMPATPTCIKCQWCLSDVPYQAIRCKFCTGYLKPASSPHLKLP